MMRLLLAIALFLASAPARAADQADDPAETARTWRSAVVFAPSAEGPRRLTVADLDGWLLDHEAASLVIYAHGCDGVSRITEETGRFLARAGHLFIAPDSFARRLKPKSCDAARRRGGLHRAVLGWRQAELAFALGEARKTPGLETAAIALMGHSEGAIAVATFTGPPVSARIVEGWTCHAGWPEYRGLKAPADEPVLALVGADDPWFRAPVLTGDCGAFMDANDRSIVYERPFYLHDRHWLTADDQARRVVLEFLDERL